MNMNLSSHFARYLTELMEVKRNSGFALDYMYDHISEFDAFCLEHFNNSQLSKELVETWVYNTNSESRSEINRRIRTMRHFANHLNALGISAYLCPIRIRIPKPPAPHLFTDEQLAEFFHVCDSLQPTPNSRYRHIVFPTMFRVIYCCGLRSSEVSNLKYSDVNLDKGQIKVLKSKGHKDRVVYFTPDLLRLCIKYDSEMEKLLPNREFFFPSGEHKHLNSNAICSIFKDILKKTSYYGRTSKIPTCHSLRHTFAANSMRQCIASGDNFDGYIQYLSKYMGHKNPQETMYYLHVATNIIPVLKEKAKGFEDIIGGVLYAEE